MLHGLEANLPDAAQHTDKSPWTTALALPIARGLILNEAFSIPDDEVNSVVTAMRQGATDVGHAISDAGGSRRPVFTYLTLHLLANHLPEQTLAAAGLRDLMHEQAKHWLRPVQPEFMTQLLWARVWLLDLPTSDVTSLPPLPSIPVAGGQQSVRQMTADESLDGYIFDELASLQALAHLVVRSKRFPEDLGRLPSACRYHLENTQPDNVTNQPWGLAAFMLLPETESFAQQQVHDCLTFASQQQFSPAATITSLLLLADSLHIATHAAMS